MRKIINQPEAFVDETLEGIYLAHPDRLKPLPGNPRVILSARPAKPGKVGIVTAGGSGHLPLFLGYVGEGMIDGCAAGNVFASPSAESMYDMIRACDFGSGVLCLYGNYGGDKMNFEMAREMAEFDDIETRSIRGIDDVASAGPDRRDSRRGVAGIVYAYKIAGAAADRMMTLDQVEAVTNRAIANIRSMGVALTPCILPEVGRPTFEIADDEIEVGMGIHGEPGIEVRKMLTADEIAEVILDKILADMPLAAGDEVSVLINGLGATPLEEQYIVYRRVHQILTEKGIRIYMPHIGEFATSMEMAGLSVTLFKLDEELKELLSAPAATPFYTNLNK